MVNWFIELSYRSTYTVLNRIVLDGCEDTIKSHSRSTQKKMQKYDLLYFAFSILHTCSEKPELYKEDDTLSMNKYLLEIQWAGKHQKIKYRLLNISKEPVIIIRALFLACIMLTLLTHRIYSSNFLLLNLKLYSCNQTNNTVSMWTEKYYPSTERTSDIQWTYSL